MRISLDIDPDEWDRFALEHGWFWHTTHWQDHAVAYTGSPARLPAFKVVDGDEVVAIAPQVVDGTVAWAPAWARDDALDLCLRERERLQLSPLVPSFSDRAVAFTGQAIRRGWQDRSLTTTIIDLTRPENELLRGMSKGHRHAIRHGDHIRTRVTATNHDFDIYRRLHEQAAGRVTRPVETFAQMRLWLGLGHGAVVIADIDGQPVGAAYLIVFGRFAYYASAASVHRREPIGHAIMWTAVRWLKNLGLRRFELGVQHRGLLPHDVSTPKEQSVALFKRGFGGTEAPLLIRDHDHNEDDMTRFKVTGIPLTPSRVLEGRKYGDEFDANLDEDTERVLVSSGALRVLESQKREEPHEPVGEPEKPAEHASGRRTDRGAGTA
jgi:Acetyltransferase (GNAT) domain